MNTSAHTATQPPTQILVLISHDPSHPLAAHALKYVKASLKTLNHDSHLDNNRAMMGADNADNADNTALPVRVFFYGEAAALANEYRWQSADWQNLTRDWQQLADVYGLDLPVCVSTALSRGVTDSDNSQRHGIGKPTSQPANSADGTSNDGAMPASPSNLATDFRLVGLGELATLLYSVNKVIQF